MLLRDANPPSKTPIITDPPFGPVWYDDSAGFIYVAYEGGSSKLVKSNVTGGGKTYVTRNAIGGCDSRPRLKGRDILRETGINGVRRLARLKGGGSEVAILGEGNSRSWHPTENKFVFIKDGGVCEMDMENNQMARMYSAATGKNRNIIGSCSQPSYSRDGNYTLFAKGANTFITAAAKTSKNMFTKSRVETQRQRLFLMNANGTGQT
jgi:hypothetical protein